MGLRIALTHAHSWPEVRRGGERLLHELASALRRRGHDVTVFAGASSSSTADEDGVRVVRIERPAGGPGLRDERVFGRKVLLPLIAGRFDVVHSLLPSDGSASVMSAALHRHRRSVYTCLGSPVRRYWDGRPDARAHRRVVRGIDVYGCLSRYALDRLREDYGRNGALTPGGVSLSAFEPRVARAAFPTLLYSGTLDEPRKGVPLIIEALQIVAREVPDVRLQLSGPGDAGPLLNDAPAVVRDRVDVLGVGSIDDQPMRYAAAWATVVPSRDEAFGLVAVESLASGTPIVVSDHAALPELVEPGAGVVTAVGDAVSLARGCLEALELASNEGARDACREVARGHDWDEAVAPAIEALYLGDERDAAAQS